MSSTRSGRWSHSADEHRPVRWLCKLSLATVALLVVLFLLSLLPGLDVSGSTFAALADAIVALAIGFVALLGYLATALPSFVLERTDAPPELREHGASLAFWLSILAAILVAHRGLEPAVAAMGGNRWFYDALFLLSALPPLVGVAAHLWAVLDPAADYAADRVTGYG